MKKYVIKTKKMELKVEDQKSQRKKTKPKKANGFYNNPTKPKKADNGNENDNDNENENEDDNGSNIINEKDVAKIDELMIQCLNTTNTNNILECTEYLKHLPIELIEYGLRKTARKQYPSWQYAMTILDDYVRKKFTTIAQVKADELGYKSQVKKKTAEEEFLNEQD